MPSKQASNRAGKQDAPPGLSWGKMLMLLLVAILAAALIAYRMIYPFFHRH